MTARAEVFAALESERAYQAKWETESESKGLHSLEEFFVYMRDYIDEAQHILSRRARQEAFPKALDIMRKVAALGVAAMEQHGAPQRPGHEVLAYPR
jgi:hypothetical protein